MAESNSQCEGAQCGRCLWESGWHKSLWRRPGIVPGRGTGDSPHMQAAASTTLKGASSEFYMESLPEGKDNPWWSQFPKFFNIIHTLLPRTLQIILFTLAYSEKHSK